MGPDILIEKNAAASGVLHMSFSRHLRGEKQETFALPKSAGRVLLTIELR